MKREFWRAYVLLGQQALPTSPAVCRQTVQTSTEVKVRTMMIREGQRQEKQEAGFVRSFSEVSARPKRRVGMRS